MAKKRKTRTPEERAEWKAEHERLSSMLQERIDYYEAKIKAKEQAQ